MDAHQRTPSVEERLMRLEDRAAILELHHRYGHLIDYGDAVGWVDCFTDEAVLEVHTVEGKTMRHAGRDALLTFASAHSHAPELYHKHFTGVETIQISGDEAACACYYVLVVGDRANFPVLATFGRYRDRLARCADGRWRYAHRVAESESWNPLWAELRGFGLSQFLRAEPDRDRTN
jgi:hypothetical protein